MKILGFIRNNILLVTLLPLLVLAIGASYLRFMVLYDYSVTYEGFCDPETSICFEYCEDDECLEPFYYAWIERDASTLREICDDLDVASCEASQKCAQDEENCSVSFCDPAVDSNCESIGDSKI
tara:strand:- start:100 stop:471 length:372 start_codon:yes stop_codon:yes gene_type:complete